MSTAGGRSVGDTTLAEVVRTMESVLGRPLTSTEEPFFHLGGRSMTLMVLLARIKRRFGAAVLPSAFLETPTAAGLAKLVEESIRRKGG